MAVIWTDPTPGNSCEICRYHAGSVFAEDAALPLPVHEHCECFYVPATEEIELTVINWTAVPEKVYRHWLRYAANILRRGVPLPPSLASLESAAVAYNRQREEETTLRKNTLTSTSEPLRLAATNKPREYRARLIRAGRIRNAIDEPGAFIVEAEALKTAVDRGLFNGLACFIDHADWLNGISLKNLFGSWHSITYDETETAVMGTLRYYDNDATRPIADLFDQILADAQDGQPIPDVGVSLVFYPIWTAVSDGPKLLSGFKKIESGDLVFTPAADGRILEALSAIKQKENVMDPEEETAVAQSPDAAAPATPARNPWLDQVQAVTVTATLALSGLPQPTQRRLLAEHYDSPAELDAAISQARAELAALAADGIIQMHGPAPRQPITDRQMTTPIDQVEAHMDWFFGVKGAAAPPPSFRRFDQLYVALTGDADFYGRLDESRITLTGAGTSDLAGLAANAMNKVIVQQWSALSHWRWYEQIAVPTPNDGSVQAMQWTTVGGIGNLPTVAEKGAYTELSTDDAAESASFVKKGGYVGITLEMIRNSDIMKLQAIPRGLATAALRTRSATISAIFTSNSGVGPTLGQDSTALFHTNHSNVATTAFSSAAWRAARLEAFKHTEVNSSKALAVFPKFCLVPADLFDTALIAFGYGDGYPTSYTPEAQARSAEDPRPVALVVPDWTDATDWAYIVDPQVYPVIHISYAQAPGGGVHPMPELFSVVSPTSGLVFTNDTLPIKVRDWFAAGVNGPRGIGKRNVA